MCTAVSFASQNPNRRFFYFARTLDNDRSYGEESVTVPRNFPFRFRYREDLDTHAAMIGTAFVAGGTPLFYDAVNEHGLAMAGLNFPQNAYYEPYEASMGENALCVFELIPYLLGTCETVAEVRTALAHVHLVDTPFSKDVPNTPLHFLIADRTEAITVEPTREGLCIYKNPLGVMTNNPPFPMQMASMQKYRNLSPDVPPSFLDAALPSPDCLGLGAVGLPGDTSSPSRFVRAAFVRHHMLAAISAETGAERELYEEVFHLLDTVSHPRGVCIRDDGRYEITVYTSVMDALHGIYYKTTYDDRTVIKRDLWDADLEGRELQKG